MNEKEKQCIDYLKSSSIFEKILHGFREKYRSYGKFAGKVTVRFKTDEERETLEGFMQRNYHGKASALISAEAFERAIAESRFAGIDGKTILEKYFSGQLLTKREEKETKEKQWEELTGKLKAMCREAWGTAAGEWADEIQNTQRDSAGFLSYIRSRYKEAGEASAEAERLMRMAVQVIAAFEHKKKFAENPEYLPVFAARLTGNPHAFDAGKKDGHFFWMLICWWANKQNVKPLNEIFPALQRQKQYLACGIILDDVSNFAMLSGITALKNNGELHRGMQGFQSEGEMVHIPLAVLVGWKKIVCPHNRIYIVENPSVYAMLCGKSRGKYAVMCMNGQPRISAVMALDLLSESETEVFYSGDLDPEGLLIAQKIRKYYKGKFHYWHMSADDYFRSKSEKILSEKRVRMLDLIDDDELLPVAEAIKKGKTAGYQENIWDVFETELF